MAESERDKLTAEVYAFRNVVRQLTNPMADLLATLLSAEKLINLAPPLPLVDVDPFGAVPDAPNPGASTAVSATQLARQGLPVVSPSPPPQRRPAAPQSAPLPGVNPDSSDAPVSSLLFSLRKRGTSGGSGQPQTSEHRILDADAAGASQQPTSAGPTPQSVRLTGTSATGGNASVRLDRLRSALTQVAQFAEEIMQRPLPGSISADAAPAESDEDPAAGSSAAEQPQQVRAGSSQLERLVAQADQASMALPAPLSPQPSVQPGVGSGNTLATIDAHAGHLLRSGTQTQPSRVHTTTPPGSMSAPGAERPEATPPARHDRAGSIPLAEAQMDMLTTAPASRSAPPEGPSLQALILGQQVDIALLAELVNEVLIEQARRHGVDLS